jgi:DNA polymerase-1
VEGACVEIRSAFKASSDDTVLLAVDYSQVEMRVLAHCCSDRALIEVFNAAARTVDGEGTDVYKRLASNVFHMPVGAVTASQRSQAKTVALGLVYGLGSHELARKLGVTTDQANSIQNVFMSTYPGIKRFMTAARKFAAKHGFVLTLTGRRRYLPDINSSHPGKRTYAERQAVNSIIQGSAADLIAIAMVRLNTSMWRARTTLACLAPHEAVTLGVQALAQSRLLLQIHDELLCECPRDLELCRAFVQQIRQAMECGAAEDLARISAEARRQVLQASVMAQQGVLVCASDMASILGSTAELQVSLKTTAQVGANWGGMVEAAGDSV